MEHRTFAFTDKIYKLLLPNPLSEEEGAQLIRNKIEEGKPCMISRFGSTELQTLSYIRLYPLLIPLKKRTYYNIQYMSGFFPISFKNLKRFYKIYKEDVKLLDILMSWRFEELFFLDWINKRLRIDKKTLDLFFNQKKSWTSALEGKRVLVVSPFSDTIISQYNTSRNHLFPGTNILPKFKSLSVVKAVQSIAGNAVGFDSWFHALNWMKDEMDKVDYDVAILGCGAYGMPLAAHAKRNGKVAIHMGGATQFLFGIKGVRFEENPSYNKVINEYFIYPKDEDRPKNASVVEGGCYWSK